MSSADEMEYDPNWMIDDGIHTVQVNCAHAHVVDCFTNSYMQVTQMPTGEGVEIKIDEDINNTTERKSLDLTWSQWEVLKRLVETL